MPDLLRTLFERRVPHALAIYAGASWAVVEFVAFAVDEFVLSPYLTRVVLAGLLLLLPTVFILAWFHGKPGKDREELARTEKIGIPANLVLCAAVLWGLFGGRDLGAATTSVTFENEDGQLVERTVLKPEFRKRTALFALDPGEGLADDELWATYAVPIAIEFDLMADDHFVPLPLRTLAWSLMAHGYSDLHGAPLSLKREAARERFAEFLVVGEIGKVDDRYRVTLTVHETRGGSVVGESIHEGMDLLSLVDGMSASVRTALGIPWREEIEDLPVQQRLTEDHGAQEEFVRALMKVMLEWDPEGAIEHLTAATTLDPTFTAAYLELSRQWIRRDRPAEALGAIQSAMEYLYRLPERAQFQVRTEFYLLRRETDRVADILEMWLELYPEDLSALDVKWKTQVQQDDLEGALATLTEMYRLNPGNGRLLLELGAKRADLGQYEEAAAAFTEYVDRFPDDEEGVAMLAGFQRLRGEHDAARANLEKAALLHPLSWFIWDLADLDLETGRFEDARRGYERARDRAGTPAAKASALLSLKRYHHFRGELGAAIGTMQAWLAEVSAFTDPVAMPDARVADILLYLDAGRVGEAAGILEELEAAELGTDYFLARARVRVALASDDVEAAREAHGLAFEAADSMRYGDPQLLLMEQLGRIQEHTGEFAAAAESYREALASRRDPRVKTDLHLGAGRALRKAGRLDEAEAELRQTLLYMPAHPHAHLELALVLEARGNVAEAIEHLRSALATWENADASFEPAREARAKLEELGG